jgi:hypothetical protein
MPPRSKPSDVRHTRGLRGGNRSNARRSGRTPLARRVPPASDGLGRFGRWVADPATEGPAIGSAEPLMIRSIVFRDQRFSGVDQGVRDDSEMPAATWRAIGLGEGDQMTGCFERWQAEGSPVGAEPFTAFRGSDELVTERVGQSPRGEALAMQGPTDGPAHSKRGDLSNAVPPVLKTLDPHVVEELSREIGSPR